VWRKYPAVDTIIDRELVTLEIGADVPGAVVFVDLVAAGKAPLTIQLPAGDHLIAVAAGTKRGWAAGTRLDGLRVEVGPITSQIATGYADEMRNAT
jgi:hypothetical protein